METGENDWRRKDRGGGFGAALSCTPTPAISWKRKSRYLTSRRQMGGVERSTEKQGREATARVEVEENGCASMPAVTSMVQQAQLLRDIRWVMVDRLRVSLPLERR